MVEHAHANVSGKLRLVSIVMVIVIACLHRIHGANCKWSELADDTAWQVKA